MPSTVCCVTGRMWAAGAQDKKRGVRRAAELNDVQKLRALLGASPELTEAIVDDFARMRPLHCACRGGAVDTVDLLLDLGADCRARNEEGYTPFILACKYGRAAVVKLLLARGFDPSIREGGAGTGLIWAAPQDGDGKADHVAVIRMLLEDGREPVDARDRVGRTALWYASRYGKSDRACVLLAEGHADHTIPDHQGRTPLDVAREFSSMHYGGRLIEVWCVCGVKP